MRNRLSQLSLAVFSLALIGSPLAFLISAEKNPVHLGKTVADFSLKDTKGQTVSLSTFKEKKAIVVVFLGTECPVNNQFMPRLAELSKSYASQGVQFLAINSNSQDTPEKIATHAKYYDIRFPVLKDDGSKVADAFGAERTPEAFLLDPQRVIRYHGRIDDQFGVAFKRPEPSRRDLAIALDEVLAGKPVSQPTTQVAGCLIGRPVQAKAEGKVTFTKQVARVLQNNCQECHRPGQIGPMPLLTYDDAAAWSETIREVVQEGRMPPWYADPNHGKFANDRRLPKEDKEALLAWIADGCPKGDDKDMPPAREFVEGWRMGKPDMIFTMQEEYDVPANAPKTGIPYKYFIIETNFTEDRWIERAEAKEGARSVVHHIVVFIVSKGQKFNPEMGGRVLVGTAPGDMPFIGETGTGKRIPVGASLILQLHYTPNGIAQKDRSSVGVVFAKEPPKREIVTMPVASFDFKTGKPTVRIPPGDDNCQIESWFRFSEEAQILTFMPHMHLRGKDFLYEVIYPDGKKETLLSVPRFNFNWQSVYRLAEPKPVPKGARLHCVAHFDNSAKNPSNPDPTQEVLWGDQTWEEMMIGWTDFVYNRPAK